MNEKEIHAVLKKITKVVADAEKSAMEAERVRDNAFSELLSNMSQDYDKVVALVRVARYEMIFRKRIQQTQEYDVGE